MNHAIPDNGRSLTAIVSDIRNELIDFFLTRFEILQQEFREKLARLKAAAPLAAIAAVLLGTSYLLITLAIVAAISVAFASSPYRWFFGFLAVGIAWGIFGAIVAYMANRELRLSTWAPNRTLAVLKGDKAWLQTEVKNQA